MIVREFLVTENPSRFLKLPAGVATRWRYSNRSHVSTVTRVRLTKRAVDKSVPRDKPFVLYDGELAGFGLRDRGLE